MKFISVNSQENPLEQQYRIFQDLILKSKSYLGKGSYSYAAVFAEVSAYQATWKHNGLFVSHELEEILQAIAKQTIKIDASTSEKNTCEVKKVLHVASMVSGLAGLQHFLRRWIELDKNRCHIVAVSQPTDLIPDKLQSVVAASGGFIELIGNSYKGIIERAQRIRDLSLDADLVVLHLQTEDIAPIIGLSQKQGLPPVALVNHADHAFWVGGTIVDSVINLRNSGLRLCQDRRDINPKRLALLPTPIEPLVRDISRQEAKSRLGLPTDAILVVSVARAPKFIPRGNINFPLTHIPVLQKHQNCFLFVVGPEQKEDWDYASQQTNGRVKAFGLRSDTSLFFQAADIYADAFPMVSVTSLLEAGSFGLPLISCCVYSAEPAIWCADAPGFDRHLIRCQTIDDYRSKLCRLIEDTEFRTELGRNTQEEISRQHIGDAWLKNLDAVYPSIKATPREITPVYSQDQRNISELDLITSELLRDNYTLEEILYQYKQFLPFYSIPLSVWAKSWLISVITKLGLKEPIKKILSILMTKK
jgi:hypothetical protein